MERLSIDTARIARRAAEGQDCQEFLEQLLSSEEPIGPEEYVQILEDCDRYGMSERQLWQKMVRYRTDGVMQQEEAARVELGTLYGQKLRQRIVGLIGKLPWESLEEFRGLMAFTVSFLSRVQFVCDLVVYLFAEREKGEEREPTDKRAYLEFFVQKLMWELDSIRQLGERIPLQKLNEAYVGWVVDRMLDGEELI
jgi:hypothetical protein